jgi:dihydroxyacid dehydratase/phosphogluconate dehydratase
VYICHGGSINSFIHIPAIAHELGLPSRRDFDRITRRRIICCHIHPMAVWLDDWKLLAGIAAVMKVIAAVAFGCAHCHGRTLGEELAEEEVN